MPRLELVQHVRRAQARGPALRATGHGRVPVERLVVALEELGELAEQQAAVGLGALGGRDASSSYRRCQAFAVVRAGIQRRTHGVGLVVLRAAREHVGRGLRVAERRVLAGHQHAQLGVRRGGVAEAVDRGLRIGGAAVLAQLAGAQQGDPRVAREAGDHLRDDAVGELRPVEPLGEAAEARARR